MTGGGLGMQAAGSGVSDSCTKGFAPLREEAERRAKLIRAAADRKAPPEEACKLISSFGQAEMKMLDYVEANAKKCGIPQQIGDQLKEGRKKTAAMQMKVCGVAAMRRSQPAVINDIGDPAMEPYELFHIR